MNFSSNSRISKYSLSFVFFSFFLCAQTSVSGQFNADNLAILVAAASANNTTVSVVEIDKTTVGQPAIQTIAISGTGANAIRVSGSATSTLYGTNSDDGSLFCFTGHNNTTTSSNANTLNPRAVVKVDHTGAYSIATTYTSASGNQTRSATTIDNSNFYIADQGGQFTNGTTTASPTGNFRSIKSFGGTVYVGQASGTPTAIQVATTSSISGGTITGLSGLSNNANLQDFYLVSSGSNGSTYDILYIVSSTSNTAGTIAKYSLVSGTWTANGSFTTTFGGFGIVAEDEGDGANIYVSTGQGALTANSVRKLTDGAGYNATINITTNVILYTAATGSIIKGLAFAPKLVSTATITTAGNPTSLSTTYGTASASSSFTVEGADLVSDILVTAPAGFEVSVDDMTFAPSVSLTPVSGMVASTIIYVRLAATSLVSGSPYSGNIVCTSTGAATQNVATLASTVSPLGVDITGATAEDKIYDGNNIAMINGGTIATVNGDIIQVVGAGTFAQATVGTNISVTPNLSLSGTNASSYQINSQPMGLEANITTKALTITGLTADNKLFDGTTTATLSGTPTLVGVIMDDVQNVMITGSYVADFTSPNVGTNIPVIVSGYMITGSAANNYSLSPPNGLSADITSTPSPVITSSLMASATYGEIASIYTITATETPTSFNATGLPDGLVINTSNGQITGTPTGLPGTYNVMISAINAGGTGSATLMYMINPKTLTVINALADDKIYDRTDVATISGSTLVGVFGSDDVTISTSGVFASIHIGSGITVTSTQTLLGVDAPKYVLTLPLGLMANITPKSVTIAGATAQNKVYDGNTTAKVTGTLSGVVSPDVVTLTLSGNFVSSAVGNGIAVNSTSTIGGADVGNYQLIQPMDLTANITGAIIANWTFEPLQGTSSNPTPNIGTGSSNIVGSMTGLGTATGMNTATGCGTQTSGTTAWAIGTANPGASNESSGSQFNTSTVGYENIVFSWEQRWSNTSTNTVRLQYTTDGTNWNNFDMASNNTTFCLGSLNDGRFETNTIGDQYRRITVDFSSIPLVNGKPNFGVRILAAHYQTTGQFRQTGSPTTVATGGTWRFDNVKFEGQASATPTTTPVNLSVSANIANESDNTLVTITATADSPVLGNQTVSLGVSGVNITGDDYYLSNNTITILDGQTQGSVSLLVIDDGVLETDENITVTISNPSAGLTLGTIITQDIIIRENNCSFLRKVGTATSTNGAEIPAFDPISNRIFIVAGSTIEYYTLSNVGIPTLVGTIALGFVPPTGTTAIPNSVSVNNGILAVAYAIQNTTSLAQQPGSVGFYNSTSGAFINVVQVGYLPDMLIFSPDGTKVLTADEGEPNSYGQGNSFDPEGSVSIINIANGVENATVQIAGFTSFNGQITTLRDAGVRIFGPGATVAQDLEPEYIAFSGDGLTAFVTLQENNAFAVLDINTATITQILPMGRKDFNLTGNGIDASDRDLTGSSGTINIQNWPVSGLYQPDAIASYTIGGQTYYVTANEGDARAYTGFSEEIRVGAGGYVLDPTLFPNAVNLKLNNQLGRLQVTSATGDIDMDGDFDRIDVYGARSFSIWNGSGSLVFDSGDQFEQMVAAKSPATFNSEGTSATFDTRSDNKGPEPEGVTIGHINNVPYAFIGIERSGDIMVYNISNPISPVFVQYINTPQDLALEGLTFVSAENSPTKKPLLITASEVSMTVTVYEVGTAIVTNSANDGSGSLREVIGCVMEGGIVTYDQPTTTTTILTDVLNIDKSFTILGLNVAAKPEITVDFTALGLNSGVIIGNNKELILNNVDFKDVNNTNIPNNSILDIKPDGILKVLESTVINKQ